MAGQSNPYTPITFSAVLPLKNGIFTVNMPPPPPPTKLGSMLDVKPLPLKNVNGCIVGCFQCFVSDTTTTELRMIVRLLLHVYFFLKHSQIKVSVLISQLYMVWSYRNHD